MNKKSVIIPSNLLPKPADFEISAAMILARYFKHNVEFITRKSSMTPDVKIGNIEWEIKSPVGNGKHNIEHQLQRAMKQSKNIVFDARQSKIDIRKIRKDLMKQAILTRSLKRLLLIEKTGKILVIK